MKRFKFIYLVLAVAVVLSGCKKDDLSLGDVYPNDGTMISLKMGDQEVIETRSGASAQERTIADAYVLVFKSDVAGGTYLRGEQITVNSTTVTGNGTQTPVIKPSVTIGNTDQVVVLLNTGCTFTTIPLTVGTSTIPNINTAFPSTGWNINQSGDTDSGKGMPMYGKMVWGTDLTCQMTRAVAKIQVRLSDGTNQITSINSDFNTTNVTYALHNVVESEGAITKGNIVAPASGVSVPSGVSFVDTPSAQKLLGATTTKEKLTYYMPEYGSSTLAKTNIVNKNEWHTDRPCIIVKDGLGKFYRLDLFKIGADSKNEFIDIVRNTHIIVSITKVKSAGYDSESEALKYPGSNLEYNITVDDGSSYDIVSNNAYYLGVSNSEYIAYVPTGEVTGLKAVTLNFDGGKDYSGALPTPSVSVSANLTLTSSANPASGSDVVVTMAGGFTTGTITIKLGNLTKVISVTRKDSISGGVNSDFSSAEYTVAEFADGTKPDWLSLGTSSSSFSDDAKINSTTGVYLSFGVVYPDMNVNRNSDIFLARANNDTHKGRVRAHILQKGSTTTFKWAITSTDNDSATAGTGVTGSIGVTATAGHYYMGKQITLNLMGKGATTPRLTPEEYPAAYYCWSQNSPTPTSMSDANYVWYLPAQMQLQAMWITANGTTPNITTTVGNFGGEWEEDGTDTNIWQYSKGLEMAHSASFTSISYWSATEGFTNSAWTVTFNSGGTSNGNKTNRYYVRCVREL